MNDERRRFLRRGAAGALLMLGGASCNRPPTVQNRPLVMHPLQGVTDFGGEAFSPPSLVGEVTLIDFWASWCAPCRQAFRHLDQLYRTYIGDGLQVLAISVDDDPKAGRRFFNRLRPYFPVAWDPSGEVRDRFGVSQLPTTLLLDRQARLIHRHTGFDLATHRILEAHVRQQVRGA